MAMALALGGALGRSDAYTPGSFGWGSCCTVPFALHGTLCCGVACNTGSCALSCAAALTLGSALGHSVACTLADFSTCTGSGCAVPFALDGALGRGID